jgi:hypothetical protein
MTSFASSPVRQAVEGYVAGRITAARVVEAVAATYYRETGDGKRETLRPLIDVIERAAPGVVELAGRADGRGFEVRLAERPFPDRYEADLRREAEAYLNRERAGEWRRHEGGAQHAARLLARVLGAIRRLFTASA